MIDASLSARQQEQGRELNTRQTERKRRKNTQTRACKAKIATEGAHKKGRNRAATKHCPVRTINDCYQHNIQRSHRKQR